MKHQKSTRLQKGEEECAPEVSSELAAKFARRRERSDSVDTLKEPAQSSTMGDELAKKFKRLQERTNSEERLTITKQGSIDQAPIPAPRSRASTNTSN